MVQGLNLGPDGWKEKKRILPIIPLFLPFSSMFALYIYILWCYVHNIFIMLISSLWNDHVIIILSPSLSHLRYFVWYKYSPFSLLVTISLEYPFPSLHFQSKCVLKSKVSFLYLEHNWILFFFLIYSVTLYLISLQLKYLLIEKNLLLSFCSSFFCLFLPLLSFVFCWFLFWFALIPFFLLDLLWAFFVVTSGFT